MKKAILFDIDGVLLDSMSMHFQCWDMALATVGIKIVSSDYHNLGGSTAKSLVDFFSQKQNIVLTKEQIVAVIDTKHIEAKKQFSSVKPYVGVANMLSDLEKAGISICAVTGMPKARAVEVLAEYFPHCFAYVTGYGDYELGKPHPDPFVVGWEKTGFTKADCIVVEDSPLGIRSAVCAGIDSIGIATSVSAKTLRDAGATYVVSDHVALIELLEKLTE